MRFRQDIRCRFINGLFLVTFFIFFMGLSGVGWTLTTDTPLLVEGDRLSGHLSQVTLRKVLEQLKKQLSFDYEIPAGELDQVISVDLQQTPIFSALAKILAPWDYAFTVNGAGRLQFLYITPKAPLLEGISERSVSSDAMPSNEIAETGFSPLRGNNTEDGSRDSDLIQTHQRATAPVLPHSSSSHSSPAEEFHGLPAPVARAPMAIQPVPEGTTMPMMPAGPSGGMQVTPASGTPNMPIIPATSYPPMDIQPVPGYLKEEMLRSIQP